MKQTSCWVSWPLYPRLYIKWIIWCFYLFKKQLLLSLSNEFDINMYHAVKVIPCFCSFSVDWYFYLLLQDWTSVKNTENRNLWEFISTPLKQIPPPKKPLSGGDAIWSNQNQSNIITSHWAGFHFFFLKTTWCFLNLKMMWQLVIKVQSVFKHHRFYKKLYRFKTHSPVTLQL